MKRQVFILVGLKHFPVFFIDLKTVFTKITGLNLVIFKNVLLGRGRGELDRVLGLEMKIRFMARQTIEVNFFPLSMVLWFFQSEQLIMKSLLVFLQTDDPIVTFVWKENLPLPTWHWAKRETGATFSHLYWMQRS